MIRILAIAVAVAFATGFGSGLYLSHDFYRVASLRAQVKSHRDQETKLREALGLNQELDNQDTEAEINNEEVLRAIRSKPTTIITPIRIDCVSAERMRDIKRLR